MQANEPSQSPETEGSWSPRLLGIMLVLLVAAVYWPTLSNGFIWDDDAYIENNLMLRSVPGLLHIWFTWNSVPQYYPLLYSLFWVEFHLWGFNPLGYHAVNLILQMACVLLAWRVLVRLKVPGAWLAAALYAVHPVCVESVAWVTEAKNLLSGTLALGSILCYLRFRPPEEADEPPAAAKAQPIVAVQPDDIAKGDDTEQAAEALPPAAREGWWYEASLVLYIGALLSKTAVVSVPAVLLVIYWWKRGRITWRDAAHLAPFFVFGLALGCVTIWVERNGVGAKGGEWDFSLLERVLLAGRALWFYAGKLVWPYPIIFFYPRWIPDATVWWQYLYPVGAVAVIVALWLARGRIGRGPLAAVLIFAGVLFPVLGFFDVYSFRYSFVTDHFQYHAALALLALLAAAAATLAERVLPREPWAQALAVAVLLVPLGLTARNETYVYRDVNRLYQHVIAKNPDSWAARYNLGVVLERSGRQAEAIARYREAMQRVPPWQWYRTLGPALRYSDQPDQVEAELQRAIELEPDPLQRAEIMADFGNLLSQRNQFERAVEQFKSAIKLSPKNVRVLTDLAYALVAKGEFEPAVHFAQQIVEHNQNYPEGQRCLGTALLKLDRANEALQPLAIAVRLQPTNARFREDFGVALLRANKTSQAEQQLRLAISLNPGSATAYNALGAALLKWSDVTGAISAFESALRIDPKFEQAAANLESAHKASTAP